eukprot:TRINITY_DN2750_c0_g1_i2.p1 TRINITY_DN2750_c0_g1~~TRINITY_DN2750_c0_g1_i2.p1  ORF type:complete len:719 (+),score=68.60 TRINITY_DN2750_c0_g1_i2:74-2158(+)
MAMVSRLDEECGSDTAASAGETELLPKQQSSVRARAITFLVAIAGVASLALASYEYTKSGPPGGQMSKSRPSAATVLDGNCVKYGQIRPAPGGSGSCEKCQWFTDRNGENYAVWTPVAGNCASSGGTPRRRRSLGVYYAPRRRRTSTTLAPSSSSAKPGSSSTHGSSGWPKTLPCCKGFQSLRCRKCTSSTPYDYTAEINTDCGYGNECATNSDCTCKRRTGFVKKLVSSGDGGTCYGCRKADWKEGECPKDEHQCSTDSSCSCSAPYKQQPIRQKDGSLCYGCRTGRVKGVDECASGDDCSYNSACTCPSGMTKQQFSGDDRRGSCYKCAGEPDAQAPVVVPSAPMLRKQNGDKCWSNDECESTVCKGGFCCSGKGSAEGCIACASRYGDCQTCAAGYIKKDWQCVLAETSATENVAEAVVAGDPARCMYKEDVLGSNGCCSSGGCPSSCKSISTSTTNGKQTCSCNQCLSAPGEAGMPTSSCLSRAKLSPCHSSHGDGLPDWECEVRRVAALTSQNLLDVFLHKDSPEIQERFVTWYGSNTNFQTTSHVLTSLSDEYGLLKDPSRIEFRLNRSCAPGKSMYVYPTYIEDKTLNVINAKGQKVVHVCDLFFCLEEQEKVRALVREVSRHTPLNKQCMSDAMEYLQYESPSGEYVNDAYQSRQLARKCADSVFDACEQAVSNAFNFAYFVKPLD